jgi:hypothetical protein
LQTPVLTRPAWRSSGNASRLRSLVCQSDFAAADATMKASNERPKAQRRRKMSAPEIAISLKLVGRIARAILGAQDAQGQGA